MTTISVNAETQKREPVVVALSGPAAGRQKARPQKKRRRWLAISFLLGVAVPTLLGIFYYGKVASDRYVSSAGFSIRGVEGGGLDMMGAFTGLAGSGSTTSESYIALNYLTSRDLIEELEKKVGFRSKFTGAEIDVLSRLEPDMPIEEIVKYWESMITTSFDATSGIITYDVEAFSAEDAQVLASEVLENVQLLVNRLSETARKDTVSAAEAEVQRAEAKLRDILAQIREFRERNQTVNPAASAQIQAETLGALQSELIGIRAQLSSYGSTVSENSPAKIALRRKAEALEAQIAALSEQVATAERGAAGGALGGLLADYEALEVEKTFAQQAYASTLASLEQARADADRKQRYLAVYSYPAEPEHAIYPRRLLNMVMVAAIALCLWGIATLMTYSVRDHLS